MELTITVVVTIATTLFFVYFVVEGYSLYLEGKSVKTSDSLCKLIGKANSSDDFNEVEDLLNKWKLTLPKRHHNLFKAVSDYHQSALSYFALHNRIFNEREI